MKVLEWFNAEIFHVLGWTIIHSIWQSALLLLVFKILLMLIGKANARLRYITGIAILLGILLCTIFTFQHEYKSYVTDEMNVARQSGSGISHDLQNPVRAKVAADTQESIQSFPPFQWLNIISPYCTLIWILGMCWYSIKILAAHFYMRNIRKLPGEFNLFANEKLLMLQELMGMKKKVGLIIHENISEPLTFGYFKPVILLPLNYVLQVPLEQLEMILAHELAHIKRHDYLVNIFQSILDAIYFFNPFFRLASEMVRCEREYCCDDIASSVCGDQHTMAMALTNLKTLTMIQHKLLLSAKPVRNAFAGRIFRLIYPKTQTKPSVKNPLYVFLVLAAIIFSMAKCMHTYNDYAMLPDSNDAITQLLTDNQAGHKIQVFSYQKANKDHEVFLVSTIDANPLYAYLDGEMVSPARLQQISDHINRKRTILPSDLSNLQPPVQEQRADRNRMLNEKINTIGKISTQLKKQQLAAPHSDILTQRLDSLNQEYKQSTDEIVSIAMEGYKDEVKDIPIAVGLHELLTKIILSKSYTVEDRKKLNELLKRRQVL